MPGTVWSMVAESARTHGDRDAVVDRRDRLTYSTLAAAVWRAGRSLAEMGCAPGDRIALWAPNSTRWAVLALAAHTVGAVVVPLNTRMRAPEAAARLALTRCRVVFVEDAFLGLGFVGALRAVPGTETVEIVDIGSDAQWASFLGRADRPVRIDAARPHQGASARPGDVAFVMATSGSTGTPKGVELCHDQLVQVYRELGRRLDVGPEDRLLGAAPLSHSFGLNGGLLTAWASGACYVALDTVDPTTVPDIVAAEGITVLSGPPTLFTDLMRARRGRPLDPAPRLAVTDAAP